MMVFVSVAGFIYCFLLPAGGVSRMAKNLLSAIFLLLVLSPLFSFIGQELPLQEQASAAYTENGALYAEAVKTALGKEINETVSKYTDLPYTLLLDAHISEDRVISIDRVRLSFSSAPGDETALLNALTDLLGTAPELEVQEDE